MSCGDTYNFSTGIYGRCAWECPRCHRINAPHVDKCDCQHAELAKEDKIPWCPNPAYPNPFYPVYPIYPTFPYYNGQIIITCKTTTLEKQQRT